MNAPAFPIRVVQAAPGDSSLAARLRKEVDGEVLFDAASRGRYSTDASIYQIEPIGVVVPRTEEAARAAHRDRGRARACRCCRAAPAARSAARRSARRWSSTTRKYLNQRARGRRRRRARAIVQPGVVLDALNAQLRPHGLWFPVDVSTSAQATLGGMAGNNSCGSRSIAYGNMVHNVLAIDAVHGRRRALALRADGRSRRAGGLPRARAASCRRSTSARRRRSKRATRRCCAGSPATTSTTSARRTPTSRTCWSAPKARSPTPSACTSSSRRCRQHTRSACATSRRSTPRWSSRSTSSSSGPSAVELVDRTMIGLARDIPAFRTTVDAFIKGEPDAILLVEFAGDEQRAGRKLKRAGRADGRPRPARQRGRDHRREAAEATSGKCARPASTS